MKKVFLSVALLLIIFFCKAQTNKISQLTTEKGIVSALYEAISGPIGAPRNWELFRSLFIPEAKLMTTIPKKDSATTLRISSPEQYIERNGKRLTELGFNEIEINHIAEKYGSITHVFSTYESKMINNGNPVNTKGINSIQLFFDGTRYYIISVLWEGDTRNNPIPAKYLPQ